jgi:hypothetical protein
MAGGAAVLGEESCPSLMEMLTGGAGLSAVEARGQRTLSGKCGAGPWASYGVGPKGSPRPFPFFCSFSFSFFLISYFFYNFCKKASKQFKPISKFF